MFHKLKRSIGLLFWLILWCMSDTHLDEYISISWRCWL